jgi:adenylyl-sulfate kinase
VVWLTGLPSSGKSTLGGLLARELARRSRRVELLDGDEVRRTLGRELGFSRADRDENVRRVAWVAGLLARHGVIAVVAMISPYRATRAEARAQIGDFLEVHVACAQDECIRRDVKGLYRLALAGEIPSFTGVSDPYEPPEQPELVVQTDREREDESLGKLLALLGHRGYVHGVAGAAWTT